jgi:hypothetical protein
MKPAGSSSNNVLRSPGAVLAGVVAMTMRMVAILGIAVMLAQWWPF